MNKNLKPSSSRKTAGKLVIAGCIILFLTVISYTGTAIYEWFFPPTDMHPAGLFTAVMMLYGAPIGIFLLGFGGLVWLIGFFADRLHAAKH